jgi:hypothetical protein
MSEHDPATWGGGYYDWGGTGQNPRVKHRGKG